MRFGEREFNEVWSVDFEFSCPDGENPEPPRKEPSSLGHLGPGRAAVGCVHRHVTFVRDLRITPVVNRSARLQQMSCAHSGHGKRRCADSNTVESWCRRNGLAPRVWRRFRDLPDSRALRAPHLSLP